MAAKQQSWPLSRAKPRTNDSTRSMGQILARAEEETENPRRRVLSFSSEEPVSRFFGPVGKYVYVPLTILVVILGFAFGGIG